MRPTEHCRGLFIFVFVAALSVTVFAVPGQALIRYDFEGPFFSEPPQPVLDHCVVEQDGVYHLFYLRGNPAVNIGHATTQDFVRWDVQPPVLVPGTWDSRLWAPYLIQAQNYWLMYYTGVNLLGAQQSGLAVSTNLFDWTKWPNPIYHPDPVWAEWVENGFAHGRDPHVIQYDGRYYMFVTAKTNTNRGAVARAVSDDLINWEDIGPLYVHDNWHVLESVFILQRPNGKWHMFFTEETIAGTCHMYSDSLMSGWSTVNKRVIDGGHAPQITDTHLGQMFSRHAVYNDQHGTLRYVIRFSPMQWINDLASVPKPLPLQGPWTFMPLTGDAFYYQPTFGHNAYVRNENYAKTWVGDGWLNTYEYYTGPMGYGQPGQYFGDFKTGVIRSSTFTIQGNSINFLIGGGDYPTQCYVALVDAQSGEVLFTETGKNSNEMERRYWSLTQHIGRSVYLEIADLATGPFGHICVDDIIESPDLVLTGAGGTGGSKKVPRTNSSSAAEERPTRLFPNSPNPFNPSTSIAFELGREAHARLEIFDARGAHIRTLVDGKRPAGVQRAAWDGTDAGHRTLASGVYFYRLTVDGRAIETRKMVLLK
ncbi:MAG TPA: FlgD immunoglobulin-like domain containing protein [Candidatus Krumholzibacteria bacterium]|nr:FlgD immunoglobulin-like domain containing protein [Candidatus Krumholzibacteria bacterium]